MKYELTLTLRPNLYTLEAKKQYEMTYPALKSILNNYKASCIAELTQEFNVHYHAIVDIDDNVLVREQLMNKFRPYNKWFGRKSFKPVQYEDSYIKYLVKDYHVTTKIIADPIVCDFKDLLKNHIYASKNLFSNLSPSIGAKSSVVEMASDRLGGLSSQHVELVCRFCSEIPLNCICEMAEYYVKYISQSKV